MNRNRRNNIFNELKTASRKGVRHLYTWLNGVKIAPQVAEGKSCWARWVNEGHLRPTDIYWAFIEYPSHIQWLAIRLDRGVGQGICIDLTTEDGPKKLRAIEEKFAEVVENRKKLAETEDGYLECGNCPDCNRVMILGANGQPHCFFC